MFSVVTDSQFQLLQIFIPQINKGSTALSLRWVSVKRGFGIRVSVGVGFYFFFLKNGVLGLGLRLVSSLTLTLVLKQLTQAWDRPRVLLTPQN